MGRSPEYAPASGARIASQPPIKQWHERMGHATYGGEILDRVVNCEDGLTLNSGSLRRVISADTSESTD